jgi:hypothetical protein
MKKFSLKDILSGEILTKQWVKKQYKLLGLICGLLFMYIYFGYQSEKQQHHLNALTKELVDTQFTKQTLNAQTIPLTRQSAVVKLLEGQKSQLRERNTPAIRIK